MKKENHKLIIRLFILMLIITAIVIFAINYAPWIVEKAKNPEATREYLRSFSVLGYFIYILIQAVHVIIVVIPGDIINVCGGFIYGVPDGFLLSITGIMLGTVVVFYISRIFGYGLVTKFVSKDKINKISHMLNSAKGMAGMLVVCLVPFIPKDVIMYVAGLTPVKSSRLFIIYGLSRIPGTFFWVTVGAQAHDRNITEIILSLIVLVIFGSIGLFLYQKHRKKVAIPDKNDSQEII